MVIQAARSSKQELLIYFICLVLTESANNRSKQARKHKVAKYVFLSKGVMMFFKILN